MTRPGAKGHPPEWARAAAFAASGLAEVWAAVQERSRTILRELDTHPGSKTTGGRIEGEADASGRGH